MDTRQLLRKEIETVPDALLEEILCFVKALKERNLPALSRELLDASESAFAKDWLREEEDKAWKKPVNGDVVVIPFPFSDLTGAKKRPV